MKDFIKRVGIIAFVAVIGFSIVGCDLDNDGNINDDNILDGTWIGGSEGDEEHWMYVFSGSEFILKEKDGSTYVNYQKNTFSLNASNTEFTAKEGGYVWWNDSWVEGRLMEGICDIVISGNRFKITSHGNSPGWPTKWNETYTKQ
jgi:hypothetical protein